MLLFQQISLWAFPSLNFTYVTTNSDRIRVSSPGKYHDARLPLEVASQKLAGYESAPIHPGFLGKHYANVACGSFSCNYCRCITCIVEANWSSIHYLRDEGWTAFQDMIGLKTITIVRGRALNRAWANCAFLVLAICSINVWSPWNRGRSIIFLLRYGNSLRIAWAVGDSDLGGPAYPPQLVVGHFLPRSCSFGGVCLCAPCF